MAGKYDYYTMTAYDALLVANLALFFFSMLLSSSSILTVTVTLGGAWEGS